MRLKSVGSSQMQLKEFECSFKPLKADEGSCGRLKSVGGSREQSDAVENVESIEKQLKADEGS